MDDGNPCSVCGAPTEPAIIPVIVRRDGLELVRLSVPAAACGECGWTSVTDEAREALVAELEDRTLPGDDIVFPEDSPAH